MSRERREGFAGKGKRGGMSTGINYQILGPATESYAARRGPVRMFVNPDSMKVKKGGGEVEVKTRGRRAGMEKKGDGW